MPLTARTAVCCVLGWLALGQTGCNMVPRNQLLQSQNRTRQLYEQNKSLAQDRDNQLRTNQTLTADNQRMQQQLADLNASKDTLQRRVDNLLGERTQLQNRFASLKGKDSPLSDESTRQFEDLVRKYPEFEFDPQTGVSKFKTDLLFESGSDQLRPNAEALLRDFAKILNQGDAKLLNVLVVGHTDDRRVAKATTKAKHPDNWYLSSHRAIQVVHALAKHGIKEGRMGEAGYGPYQPLAQGNDAKSREKNRRVEIFVLAPNATVARRDSGASRN